MRSLGRIMQVAGKHVAAPRVGLSAMEHMVPTGVEDHSKEGGLRVFLYHTHLLGRIGKLARVAYSEL